MGSIQHGLARYMGGPVELIEAPNGAIVNAEVRQADRYLYREPTIEEVVDGVWVCGGYSAAVVYVIEAEDGLIVHDTGDTLEEGHRFRAAIREISDKPVRAILYSHSHYAMAGGALVDDPSDVLVVGHPSLNDTVRTNMQGGGAPSLVPEVAPVMTRRLLIQFGNFLPESGPDASTGERIQIGEADFVPVNRPVANGEVVDVLGIEMQFFTEFDSDDHNMTVWIPGKGVVLNNFFWPGTPNLYTLRGGEYRSPLEWRDGLKVIRDLQPDVLLSTHVKPIVGRDEVARRLNGYMDLITLTYDQTLRGMLLGLGPRDLRYFVHKPPHLAEIPENLESYGETPHFPEAIYQHIIGWFDGDVTRLYAIPPLEEAERIVALVGGKDAMVAAVNDARSRHELAWAAQLVQHLHLLEPDDTDIRQLKADILRELAYRTTGFAPRSFLLSEARQLEGATHIPNLVAPAPQVIAASPATFVDYLRIRIDPAKSQDTEAVIGFTFTGDTPTSVALHIRRGIAEYVDNPDAHYRPIDIAVTMTPECWAGLYVGTTDVRDAIETGEVTMTEGEPGTFTNLWAMFDPLPVEARSPAEASR